MCRIAYSTSSTFQKANLYNFFSALEKSNGKDGNGIYSIKTGEIKKSITEIPDMNITGNFIFHTRFATHGLKREYNLMPFIGDRYIFTHNGMFTSVYSHARLLGFRRGDKKYSDSYMMHYIMEKVGLLNFYLGFREKYYGVVLVYDKELEKTFLLKTGGSFEAGKLKTSGNYIYSSSLTDFWELEGEPEELESGLYRLEKDGYIKLDGIENRWSRYYGGSVYSGRNWSDTTSTNYYGDSWKNQRNVIRNNLKKQRKKGKRKNPNYRQKKCGWCNSVFVVNETRKLIHNHTICYNCYKEVKEEYNSESNDNSDEDIKGINSLFGEKVIKYGHCYNCLKKFEAMEARYSFEDLLLCEKCRDKARKLKEVSTQIAGTMRNAYDKEGETNKKNGVPLFCHTCDHLRNGICFYENTERTNYYFMENKYKCHSDKNRYILFTFELCKDCAWYVGTQCNVKEFVKSFVDNIDSKTNLRICNTKSGRVRIRLTCESCEARIEEETDWELYNGNMILCSDCYEVITSAVNSACPDKCDNCGLHFEGDDEIIETTNGDVICMPCSFFDKSETHHYLGKFEDRYGW